MGSEQKTTRAKLGKAIWQSHLASPIWIHFDCFRWFLDGFRWFLDRF
jgi:hypothetical protein